MESYTHRHALEAFKHLALDQTGYSTDELPWSNKYIIYKMLEIRATEMEIALEAGIGISEFSLQTLGCLPVSEMDRSECPCAPASGCYWLKSEVPLPRPIRILSVTGVVANTDNPRFTFIKWDRFQYIPTSRSASTRNGRYWTIRDKGAEGAYLYLYGDRDLEMVTITGVWENPMEVEAFPSCGEVDLQSKCNPLDVDFYTDAAMRDRIIDLTVQKLIPVRQAAMADLKNDDTFRSNPANTQA